MSQEPRQQGKTKALEELKPVPEGAKVETPPDHNPRFDHRAKAVMDCLARQCKGLTHAQRIEFVQLVAHGLNNAVDQASGKVDPDG